MIRYPAAQLLRLDARVDRCDSCGGWRFDHHCHMCNETDEDQWTTTR